MVKQISPGDISVSEEADDAFKRAYCKVLEISSLYESTGNPVFLWNAIAVMTAPELAGIKIVLPERVRSYLHEAAQGIRNAATERPSDFGQSVLQTLKLSDGVKGSSVSRRYQKEQSAAVFLRAYEVLKNHHGYSKAQELIAERLSIGTDAVHLRLVEARTLLKKAAARITRAISAPQTTLDFTPSVEDMCLPVEFWLEIIGGMPDIRHRSTGRGRR